MTFWQEVGRKAAHLIARRTFWLAVFGVSAWLILHNHVGTLEMSR